MKEETTTRRWGLVKVVLLAAVMAGTAEAGETKVFPSYRMVALGADGEFHEVVGLDGRVPLIMQEGKLLMASEKWMAGQSIKGISDNSVEIRSMTEVEAPESLTLDVTVKSNVPLAGPFAVVSWLRKEDNTMLFRESPMPDLTGEEQSFRLNFWKEGIPEDGWKLHFYHAGQEIYDVSRTDLVDATPLQSFILHLTRHLSNVAGGDASLKPYYMPVRQPPEEILPGGQEVLTVKVKITVAPNGTVSAHEFVEPIEPGLAEHLSGMVEEWIFYPRVKAGQPVAQTVVVPLKFRHTVGQE